MGQGPTRSSAGEGEGARWGELDGTVQEWREGPFWVGGGRLKGSGRTLHLGVERVGGCCRAGGGALFRMGVGQIVGVWRVMFWGGEGVRDRSGADV